jgi:hypothetical protein
MFFSVGIERKRLLGRPGFSSPVNAGGAFAYPRRYRGTENYLCTVVLLTNQPQDESAHQSGSRYPEPDVCELKSGDRKMEMAMMTEERAGGHTRLATHYAHTGFRLLGAAAAVVAGFSTLNMTLADSGFAVLQEHTAPLASMFSRFMRQG